MPASKTPIPTRAAAREIWAASGLHKDDLTPADLRDLRHHINKAMKDSGAMRDTLRCRQRFSRKTNHRGEVCIDLRCKSVYFDDRQAITFETDGFVGFAGWADDTHVAPILTGFTQWLESRAAA